jgi:hypothetical protein
MELSIDFECPECRTVQPQKVTDFSPGRRGACLACGTATELTEGSLKTLQRCLRELCENRTPPQDPCRQPAQKP